MRNYKGKGFENVTYKCVRCGTRMTRKDLEERGGENKCINCSYRVLKKVRPPIVKRIKAIRFLIKELSTQNQLSISLANPFCCIS